MMNKHQQFDYSPNKIKKKKKTRKECDDDYT